MSLPFCDGGTEPKKPDRYGRGLWERATADLIPEKAGTPPDPCPDPVPGRRGQPQPRAGVRGPEGCPLLQGIAPADAFHGRRRTGAGLVVARPVWSLLPVPYCSGHPDKRVAIAPAWPCAQGWWPSSPARPRAFGQVGGGGSSRSPAPVRERACPAGPKVFVHPLWGVSMPVSSRYRLPALVRAPASPGRGKGSMGPI